MNQPIAATADTQDAEEQLVDKGHAPSHSVVFYERDIEPVGDSYRLTEGHCCLDVELYHLIDDEDQDDDRPRHQSFSLHFFRAFLVDTLSVA